MDSLRGRTRKRAEAGGFTLVELMVVVVIVSVLAVLATPAMRGSRDDRMTFDFARRIEQLSNRARTRAAARGAAQLFVASPDGGGRGEFLLFEALDGTAAPAGPNPVSTCKGNGEWNDVLAWAPGVVSANARLIDGVNMNATTGVIVNANIRSTFFVSNVSTGAIVVCVNPAGTTWVGSGTSVSAAINAMQASVLPFNSSLEMRVLRGGTGATGNGLARKVLIAGSAAARVKSE